MTQASREDVQEPMGPAEAAASAEAAQTPPAGQLVPVTESIRYRRRAQQAERRLVEVEQQLCQEQAAKAALAGELEAARRRAELSRLMAARGVVDVDAAVLLAEDRLAAASRLAGADAEPPDLKTMAALADALLADKPYLLGGGRAADGAGKGADAGLPPASQGRRGGDGSADALRTAARRAASGRPTDMDQYLRLRRRFV